VAALTKLRANDAARWGLFGALAVVALGCCLLPTIRLGVGGYVGAGTSQRTYDLDRSVRLVPDLLARSLVLVVPALVALAACLGGLAYGSRRVIAIAAFAGGLALAVGAYRVETHLTFIESGAVVGCDQPCAGFVLEPEVREIQADLLRSPAGRQQGFAFTGTPYSYRAHPLGPWWVLLGTGLALGPIGGYGLARLAVRPWPAVVAVGAASFLVFAWLLLRALSRME